MRRHSIRTNGLRLKGFPASGTSYALSSPSTLSRNSWEARSYSIRQPLGTFRGLRTQRGCEFKSSVRENDSRTIASRSPRKPSGISRSAPMGGTPRPDSALDRGHTSTCSCLLATKVGSSIKVGRSTCSDQIGRGAPKPYAPRTLRMQGRRDVTPANCELRPCRSRGEDRCRRND
jgi:hypothetical protein